MVATNDDLLMELEKQTNQLIQIKKLIRGLYGVKSQADTEIQQ